MTKPSRKTSAQKPDALFGRIVSILEQARTNVVRAVNSNMVQAYWLIGREIIQELQGGEERAEYGKRLVETLSAKLTERYGQGFSATNLWYFKQFYLTFQNRSKIPHPTGGESLELPIPHPAGRESTEASSKLRPVGAELICLRCTAKAYSHRGAGPLHRLGFLSLPPEILSPY